MPCYDGQLGSSSVDTHFVFLRRTAMSSATGGYTVVPKRPKRNDETTSRSEEHSMNVPSS